MNVDINRDKFTPLYYQIAEELKRRIGAGVLKPDEQLPPELELAESLGVSKKTIRSTLDKLSKEGYVNRRKGKGTFVSASFSRRRVLAVVVTDSGYSGHASSSALLGGVADKACASGCELRLLPFSQVPWLVDSQGAGRADLLGLLFLRYRETMRNTLELAKRSGILCVLEGTAVPGEHYVTIDNEGAMRRAVAHLAALGHRRFGVLTYDAAPGSHFALRAAAVRQAIAELGLECYDHWLPVWSDSYDCVRSRAECVALLESKELPTAFVATSDRAAIAFVQEAKARGFALPRDFSVIGFDDNAGVELLEPPLTTFKQDYYRLGAAAAAALLDLSNAFDNRKTQLVIEPELIVRGSTAKPKGGA